MHPFWTWFSGEEARLHGAPPKQVAEELEQAIRQVDARIGVEVGGGKSERRELVFTAYGNPELFQAIRELVGAAPIYRRWEPVALKQGHGFGFSLEVAGTRVDAASLRFEPLESPSAPGAIGLRVFLDAAVLEGEHAAAVLRLVLQTGLGEERAACLAHLEAAGLDEAPDEALSADELVPFLDKHRRRFLN